MLPPPNFQTPWNEYTAVCKGMQNPRMHVLGAGVTYPDKSYRIRRIHPQIYVFGYILGGKEYLRQGDAEGIAQAGDAYILHPDFRQDMCTDPEDLTTQLWLNVSGNLVRHMLEDYELHNIMILPGFGEDKYLMEIIRDMTEDPAGCYDALGVHLLRYIQALSAFAQTRHTPHPAAYAMKEYIDNNLFRKLTIDDLADHVHFSRSRTFHLFKEVYGMSPFRYYAAQRMELAKSMLIHSSMSIRGIAEQLGFADYHHFSIFFKKECGMSPLQFRKQAETLQ